MPTFKTYITCIDLETGEILPKETADKYYYVVRKQKVTHQPDRTKSIIIIKYLYECRKKPLNLNLWKS